MISRTRIPLALAALASALLPASTLGIAQDTTPVAESPSPGPDIVAPPPLTANPGTSPQTSPAIEPPVVAPAGEPSGFSIARRPRAERYRTRQFQRAGRPSAAAGTTEGAADPAPEAPAPPERSIAAVPGRPVPLL
ncbi:MAG: hypothetical protein ACXW2T_10695, partial [Allosphingosinicella sp.]